MAGSVVDLLGVEKTYRDFWGRTRVQALHPLTLSMEPGEILALLGPNGAGKSTTIKLILGLLFPTRGRVQVFGASPRRAETRARLGYLPEETRLHKFLTPRETLDLFGRLHGLSRAERKRRIDQLIAMVGLTANANRPVGEFSKGMARRIGLAVALSGDPDLLILDEPTSGLDPLGTREIKTLLGELRERGRSILLSSHLLDDVEDLADRIAILYGGKLEQLGNTRELLTRGGKLHIELDRPEGLEPEQVASALRDVFPGAGDVDVSVPADSLESLFRRVVISAEADDAATAGARMGGPIAGFLLEGAGQPAPPPAISAAVPTPFETPPVAAPQVQTPKIEKLQPSPAVARPQDKGAVAERTDLAGPVPLETSPPSNPVVARLMGVEPEPEPKPEPEPEPLSPSATTHTTAPVLPSEASPAARQTLARLLGASEPAGPAPMPVRGLEAPDPDADETPAPQPLSQPARSVLQRILPPGKST